MANEAIALIVICVIICIVGLVILALYKLSKQEEKTKKEEISTYIKPKPEAPTQITIYQHHNKTACLRKCAYCDGENDPTASSCCVCGNVIE